MPDLRVSTTRMPSKVQNTRQNIVAHYGSDLKFSIAEKKSIKKSLDRLLNAADIFEEALYKLYGHCMVKGISGSGLLT